MKPLHVLVVARDPELRRNLIALLRSADHRVDTAPDGPAAVASLDIPGVDALLLDLGSPNLDLAALRRAIFSPESPEPDSLEAAERRHLAFALRYTEGNKRKAAHLLGISRSTLLNKVRKYGLEAR